MKAVVTTQYGPPPDVLQLTEVATPVPAEDEVLIRLYASSVNPLDGFTIRGPLFFFPKLGRLLKPKHKIAGADFAGRVESVGRDIKRFRPGEEVFGASFAGKGMGGFAEFVCASEENLAPKPSNMSFEEAAAVPVAAITALQGLRDQGQIQRGQKVLIDGSSGGVGTFAVQIAKSFGAEVTAVCSPRNVDRARVIGADHVIDYTREDFTRSGLRYDLILGANAHHSIFDYRRALSRPLMMGKKKYTEIRAPSLVIFANPHSQGTWVDSNTDPSVVTAAKAYSAALVALTEKQEKAVESGVPTAHVITLPGANHYIFLSNEADVLRGMGAFLAELH